MPGFPRESLASEDYRGLNHEAYGVVGCSGLCQIPRRPTGRYSFKLREGASAGTTVRLTAVALGVEQKQGLVAVELGAGKLQKFELNPLAQQTGLQFGNVKDLMG